MAHKITISITEVGDYKQDTIFGIEVEGFKHLKKDVQETVIDTLKRINMEK